MDYVSTTYTFNLLSIETEPMADEEDKWTVVDVNEERPEWMVIMDHASTIILTCNTITLMMGIGAATYWREMWHHLKRPWSCIIGLGCQFIILPALGFGLCVGLQLPPYQSLGVLILTCSPGGAFSNFFTYWTDGDLALRRSVRCHLIYGYTRNPGRIKNCVCRT